MKAAVLYYSKTGNTKKMAQVIAGSMSGVKDVEAKAFSVEAIDDAAESWIKESACVILGTPVYMADLTGALKCWLETGARKLNLAGKIGGAFATANYVHGGGELAIRTILDHMMVLGMMTYSGGAACGRPVIHLGPVAIGTELEKYEEIFEIYGERMAKQAVTFFKEKSCSL